MTQEDEILFQTYGIKGYADCPPEPQEKPQESVEEEKWTSTRPGVKVAENALKWEIEAYNFFHIFPFLFQKKFVLFR